MFKYIELKIFWYVKFYYHSIINHLICNYLIVTQKDDTIWIE